MMNKILDAYYSVLLRSKCLLSTTTTIFVMAGGAPRENMLNRAVNSLREMMEQMIHVTSIRDLSSPLTFNK